MATRTSETALSSGLRWSGVSVVGREAARIVFTILLARLVGPEAFGIVAEAIVYIGIVGLLLDQGFSSALIQRPRVEPDMPGAVVSVNLAVGAVLMLLTIAVASGWADFMGTPELTLVLIFLAPTLLLRSACVTPRAMLLRNMNFRTIAAVDVTAAVNTLCTRHGEATSVCRQPSESLGRESDAVSEPNQRIDNRSRRASNALASRGLPELYVSSARPIVLACDGTYANAVGDHPAFHDERTSAECLAPRSPRIGRRLLA